MSWAAKGSLSFFRMFVSLMLAVCQRIAAQVLPYPLASSNGSTGKALLGSITVNLWWEVLTIFGRLSFRLRLAPLPDAAALPPHLSHCRSPPRSRCHSPPLSRCRLPRRPRIRCPRNPTTQHRPHHPHPHGPFLDIRHVNVTTFMVRRLFLVSVTDEG
jgi:hypothetical protein